MDEATWRRCNDLQEMLCFLDGKVSERKLRLFGCACCRQVWHFMPDERSRKAIEIGEQFADCPPTVAQASAAYEDANAVAEAYSKMPFRVADFTRDLVAQHAATAAAELVVRRPLRTPVGEVMHGASTSAANAVASSDSEFAVAFLESGDATSHVMKLLEKARRIANRDQVPLLHCIGGPFPFRPVTLNQSWLTTNVVSLAQTIYDQRRFQDMPILADALEDAGCTNQEVLAHCRGEKPHVRGCWVVDLLLGKE